MEPEMYDQGVDGRLSQPFQSLTSPQGVDVLLLLIGLAGVTDDGLALESARLAAFRRSGQKFPLHVVSATAATPNRVMTLLREHRPMVLHIRKAGEEQTFQIATSPSLLSCLSEVNVRCIILEDCYTLILAETLSEHVATCMGINGRFANNFLSTIYARIRINVPWYELYSAAHWSFFNHYPETSSATENERPYFITRNTDAVAAGHARLQSDTGGYGIAGKLFRPNEPSKTPVAYALHFGTNRKPRDARDPTKGYSGERDDEQMHYGICKVVVPQHHKFGSLGSPWWKQLFNRERDDPFQLNWASITALTEKAYWASLKATLTGIFGERDSVVYIHGYNVSFEGAALRAAQLAADLKVHSGMNFFSWPSKGTFSDYAPDGASIEGSESALTSYLSQLLNTVGNHRVHIIAHSMGNRGLIRAMHELLAQAERRAGATFGQIILAAPDVDEKLFRDLANAYHSMSKRTTLYVSSKDLALGSSGIVHDHPRAGYTPPVTIVPGIDTIETSSVDLSFLGHGYYADARSVLEDMFRLLKADAPPDERFGPKPAKYEGRDYWTIGA